MAAQVTRRISRLSVRLSNTDIYATKPEPVASEFHKSPEFNLKKNLIVINRKIDKKF